MAATKQELLFEARKLVYQNAGELHRYFLSWRHQLFAGYLAVIAALVVPACWAYNSPTHSRAWIGIIGITSVLFTALFWVLEFRNRQLYRACQNVAQNIERLFGVAPEDTSKTNTGVYDELITTTSRSLNHSMIMNVFFAIALFYLTFLTLTVIFILK